MRVGLLARPLLAVGRAPRAIALRGHRPCALKGPQAQPDKEQADASAQAGRRKAVEAIKSRMSKRGMGQLEAKEVLRVWKGAGIGDDDKALKEVLLRSSAAGAANAGIQCGLDLAAAGFALYSALVLSASQSLGPDATPVMSLLFYGLAMYFGFQSGRNLHTLFNAGVAAWTYSRDPAAVLTAVRELADADGAAETAAAAVGVDSERVAGALSAIPCLLQEQLAERSGARGSHYDDLAAFVTLQTAQAAGFDASAYGITDADAADIALAFNLYDADGDGALQAAEFARLCADAVPGLSPAEAAAALAAVDADGDGAVQFSEFVGWFTNTRAAGAGGCEAWPAARGSPAA